MRSILLILTIFVCAYSFAQKVHSEDNSIHLIKMKNSERELYFSESIGAYSAKPNDIKVCEKLLTKAFHEAQRTGLIDIGRNLADYSRQFYGYVTKNGDTVIWVNCIFDKNHKLGTKLNEIILNEGGGDNYFRTTVSIRRKIYFNFEVNHK